MDNLTPLPDNAPWYVRWIVDNWRTIWRDFSTWFIGAAGLLAIVPPDMWTSLGFGDQAQRYATTACAVAALLSKYVKQGDDTCPPKPTEGKPS